MSGTTDSSTAMYELMDRAVELEPTQPEAALEILRNLAKRSDFDGQISAGELAANILFALNRYEEAEQIFDDLLRITDKPEQAYAHSRFVVRRAELLLAFGQSEVVASIETDLKTAEQIFTWNGDQYMIGKVSVLLSAISTQSKEYDKSVTRLRRGQRLLRAYGPQITPSTPISTSPVGTPAFATSVN